jgi:archaeal chaperonin
MSNLNYSVWRPMAKNIEFNAIMESNSNAIMTVADTVRTTLGPKGLDKLLIDQAMRAIHSVARMIIEIAERQGGARV